MGDFQDFSSVSIQFGAVYVLGRNSMIKHAAQIRSIIESGSAHIVFSIPTEGATTILGQFERLPTRDLIESGRIFVLSGSPIDSRYRHFYYEHFLQRILNFDENLACIQRTNEIYSNVDKPYKFLMLNGRMRPHRKWMLQSLRDSGTLAQGLHTNLHTQCAPAADLTYIVDGKDLMQTVEPIKYLPAYYEVDIYQHRVGIPCDNVDVKHHLFNNEWGEIYIKPEPYIDTYFSIVTETVYSGKHSFRTEKIWKPILIGHPWICIANKGFYADLRNMGFRTFENIIDESFDQIADSQLRIERISSIIKDVCTGDMSKFLDECNSICKYNQQHMLDYLPHVKEFPQQFVEYLRENIQ